MKESRDIFRAIERTDENGEVKAICCLMIKKSSEPSMGECIEADAQGDAFSLVCPRV